MIEIEGLTKSFGEVLAVDRLTLRVESGEVFGFLGPNGAGKTTTLRMLSALIGPTAGRAVVAGFKLGEEDTQIRRRVGILTESPGMYDRLSAERNLAFFAELYEVEDVDQQVEKYLRLLGLWDRRRQEVGGFSKGMRQKLAIARALLHEPDVLFLDEPTSGLDPQAARLVRAFIDDLKAEGRTIFLCTHNLDEADRLCDRIAVFNQRLLALDTPQALRRQLYDRKVVFHLAHMKPGLADMLSHQEGVRQVEAVDNKLVATLDDPENRNPVLIRKLVEAGGDIQFVGEIRRSLEDVYMHLVQPKGDSSTSEG
jgi:ABC-2 type transport system ATP-binding protein